MRFWRGLKLHGRVRNEAIRGHVSVGTSIIIETIEEKAYDARAKDEGAKVEKNDFKADTFRMKKRKTKKNV